MQGDQTSRDLERRKYVRLRIRPDLAISPQRFEGRSYYVIKDPVSLRYYRFKEQEYFLLGLMDGGKHTLDEQPRRPSRGPLPAPIAPDRWRISNTSASSF